MRSAVVLYNPFSGNCQEKRRHQIDAVLEVLRNARVETACFATRSGQDATEQARQAVASGYDTVFACGGDGTVNDVLQSLVGTQSSLAVIPMGTGNVLAYELGLPLRPTQAVLAALSGVPRKLAVGKIEYQDLAGNPAKRHFMVVAGIGVDAHLFRTFNPQAKQRFGMASYYAKAIYLWLSHNMQEFQVEYLDSNETKTSCPDVTQLLAVRVRHFGSIMGELAPGASLERNDMRLVLFRTKRRILYLQYVLRCMLGAKWQIAEIEAAHSRQITCNPPPNSSQIFVEADGELLGTLPVKISIVPTAVTLLAPRQ
jgi:YegS/Rv2252/BmrU family lipid kinase